MILSALLADLKDFTVSGSDQIEIENITDDSRKVTPGSLFVAVKGLKVDAHDLISQAIEAGAVAVVGEKEPEELAVQGDTLNRITYIKVENSRHALGILASTWYGNPSHSLKVIGVTGTEGKTTTCSLIWHILTASGRKAGLISTIEAKIGQESIDTGLHVTNPEAMPLQELLKKMVDERCEYAVMEATSMGLHQGRVAGVKFDIGVLTNIRQDHLDYHGTQENYTEAKAMLFKKCRVAILNKDDFNSWDYMLLLLKNKNWEVFEDYGIEEYKPSEFDDPAYKANDIRYSPEGTEFTLKYGSEKNAAQIKTSLLGNYNVSNTLAAIASAYNLDVSLEDISRALESFKTPEGRLERIEVDGHPPAGGFTVFVDFAHTPGALESVLSTLKDVTPKGKKLITVYGAAGERDASKRPAMGKAARHADLTIFTTDDPRSEDPKNIISEMEIGAKEVGAKYKIVIDRTEAIEIAIGLAEDGDIVALCGKGHEKSLAVGNEEIPWSDQEVARDILKRLSSRA